MTIVNHHIRFGDKFFLRRRSDKGQPNHHKPLQGNICFEESQCKYFFLLPSLINKWIGVSL